MGTVTGSYGPHCTEALGLGVRIVYLLIIYRKLLIESVANTILNYINTLGFLQRNNFLYYILCPFWYQY